MKILLSTYEALTTPEAVTLVKVRNPETGETILIGPDEVIPPGFEPVYEADVSATEKKADALQTRQKDYSFIFWLALGFLLANTFKRT